MRLSCSQALLPSFGAALLLMSGLGLGSAQAQDVFGMPEAHAAMSAQAHYAADAHSRYGAATTMTGAPAAARRRAG